MSTHEEAIAAVAKELLAHGEFGTDEASNRRNVLPAARAAIAAYQAALSPTDTATAGRVEEYTTGKNYADGLWSRSNADAFLEDQRAAITTHPEAGKGGNVFPALEDEASRQLEGDVPPRHQD